MQKRPVAQAAGSSALGSRQRCSVGSMSLDGAGRLGRLAWAHGQPGVGCAPTASACSVGGRTGAFGDFVGLPGRGEPPRAVPSSAPRSVRGSVLVRSAPPDWLDRMSTCL